MKYINYNNDKISKLSLGTVQFGLDYGISNTGGQPTQEAVNEIIQYVCENGINCFDTAQAYGNSEEVLGRSIKDKKNTFIISKLKSSFFLDNAIDSVTESLTNLQISLLYALLLHDSQLLYSWTDSYSLLVDKLIDSQKIKYFGVSIYTDDDFNLAVKNDKIQFIQVPFNIFDQRAITKEWFKKAKENNKLIFIRSVFLQGLLLMDIDKLPSNLKIATKHLEALELLSTELNITKNELALSFVDTVAKDALILFGCDNIKQAKENMTNYSLLKYLDDSAIIKIKEKFCDIDEKIYNPTKW